jgi:hypothetical protein
MTQTELQNVMDAMIEEQYRALGLDPDDPRGVQATPEQQSLAADRYATAVVARMKTDQEFNKAYCHHIAHREIMAVLEEWRPKGEYRADASFPINNRIWKQMPWANREDLIAWALLESDEHNLSYIASRLDAWDKRPECKTLKELEAAIS